MNIKMNAQVFIQWANNYLGFQNESQEYKLVVLKEFKDMFYEANRRKCLTFIDGRTNVVLKDIEVITLFKIKDET